MPRILILFFMSAFCGFGQDSTSVFSVYFDEKAKPSTQHLNVINSNYYQRYELIPRNEFDLRASGGDQLVVDETGIYIEKNRILSISRTEIRENSKYTLKDGYLHGVLSNDSVMVALDGENYYFLIPTKSYLFNALENKGMLYQGRTPNEFLIMTREENGLQSILMINFSGSQLSLLALDLEQSTFDYSAVTGKKREDNSIPIFILSPNKTEWKSILENFIVYDTYRVKAE